MKTWWIIAIVALAAACQIEGGKEPEEQPWTPVEIVDPTVDDPPSGEPVDPEVRPESYGDMQEALAVSEDWTPDDFLEHYSAPFAGDLSYDPSTAEYLELVQSSSLALADADQQTLREQGFVVTDQTSPSFVYGYRTIYAEDLPVFVSADAILFAMHRSYDAILKELEVEALIPSLRSLLEEMRVALNQGDAPNFDPQTELDLDLYLTVALSLLEGDPVATVAGADQSDVDELVSRALDASGFEERVLFGAQRRIDFSQFEPRGHYTDSEELERYFRAMTWLGRIDFRMLEPDDQNELQFHRRQFEATLSLAALLDRESTQKWRRIHETIGAFVGEPDQLIVSEIPDVLDALGVSGAAATKNLTDAEIAEAIQKHRFGAQRISSHFMVNGIADTTKPLSHSFALFGQRYVLDSHVFSNVVFDRVQGGSVMRMMPDPLDVAFAALGNDQAGQLLEPELREWGYQHDLDAMRRLADWHGESYWSANLYNGWMSSLRTLSPSDELADPVAAGLPEVATTDAWGRRMLNTQMASWAELRHDTILYVKQSYTGGAACEYPDAYVEPYPRFFEAVAAFATHGAKVARQYDELDEAEAYFLRLQDAALRLQSMAEQQRTGMPHSAENLAWINEAVDVEENCDGTALGSTGWYSELFYDDRDVDFDPTIADVHTQPTDEVGNPVGKVLHVGTGMPRAMVMTVETCVGPRAYVGLVSSYHEEIRQDFERLTDEEWAPMVRGGSVSSPDWAP